MVQEIPKLLDISISDVKFFIFLQISRVFFSQEVRSNCSFCANLVHPA